jgi:ATP-dependent helicase/DNAse subunit B
MAEHLRHELARSGSAVRPSRVGTLAQLLDGWGLLPAASKSLLHILMDEALAELRPARFETVREFRGVHAELARLIEEAPPGGCGEELAELFEHVEARLEALGYALRNRRLQAAADKLRAGEVTAPAQIVFDGFFTLGPAEVDFIRALAGSSSGGLGSVMVTLPTPDPRLAGAGFTVEHLTKVWRAPERHVFAAATLEREAEEIARRILEQAERGRRFREMGVVLRSRDPYGPLMETTLERFGIPARGYFLDPLGSHPAVAYLAGVVKALLGAWDYAAVNALLRMPVSGVGATPEGDRFDFALREALPGQGLPMAGMKTLPDVVGEFPRLTSWRRERLEPAEWAGRLKTLGGLIARPPAGDTPSRDDVNAWRSTAAAVSRFKEVVQAVAGFMGAGKIGLEALWKRVETALAVEPLMVEDRRREVVHVMDVYEARQWELPVVFICGLVERVFPQYHGENPVLGDAARRRLGLPTSADLQEEERFLFEMAATRATAQVVMSYPRLDERGEETLPSFFLKGVAAEAAEIRVRPKPKREVAMAVPGPVRIDARQHRRLSATSIEKFLQCPFQFFANKTLKLRERPAAPRDRLDLLAQGTILHRALAEWWHAPLLGSGVLDQVFDQECARRRVPRTYRTEAVRLELLRHFESFLKDRQVELGWDTRVEQEFEFELQEGFTIRGRIDRLEIERLELDDRRRALVIDYKYSANVKGRVRETEAGSLVQGGLYLLAAERGYGLKPAGMLYCGLKGEVEWEGWHAPIEGLERVGTACQPQQIRELMERAERQAVESREGILAGRVEAHPTDRKKCDWCDYRDICRVETITAEQEAGAGG